MAIAAAWSTACGQAPPTMPATRTDAGRADGGGTGGGGGAGLDAAGNAGGRDGAAGPADVAIDRSSAADAPRADVGGSPPDASRADGVVDASMGSDIVLPDVPPSPPGSISTDPDLKVAFIGDTTDDSAGYKSVLNLVKSEGAAAMVVSGDMSYTADPDAWWATTEAALGGSFPIFLAEGNHDESSWEGYQPKANAHVMASGATVDPVKIGIRGYHYTFKGLSMVFIGEDKNSQYPKFIMERFANDKHIWKVCAWHKNQNAMQIGGKGDEMGWEVYEACRTAGALTMTAHEHSYERTKTLTSTSKQTVDPMCSDPKTPCVGPGRVPVFVSGLGGNSIRDQERCTPTTYPYGCNKEWAFIYSSNQGAKHGVLFIVFNYKGDAQKAHGYFKNVSGEVVDEFDLTNK